MLFLVNKHGYNHLNFRTFEKVIVLELITVHSQVLTQRERLSAFVSHFDSNFG